VDAFEELVANIFRRNHYWTCTSYKVNLLPEHKRALDNRSMPRPEIDVLAYRPSDNELWWIGCKSYLDSPGIKMEHFTAGNRGAETLKMFNSTELREVVTEVMVAQLMSEGLLLDRPKVQYCLVAGKIATARDRTEVRAYFESQGWHLFDDHWLHAELLKLAKLGYENDLATMVAKIFARYKGPTP
jgi:hypothetical protein